MITPPLLTIGIPTYNGARLIGHTLDSILQQLPREEEGLVDILVSDNASTDETGAIVRAYQARHSVPITYTRNEMNLGFDRNVDMLFKKASGKYVWMLGDDDVLREGALQRVLALLKQHPGLKAIQVNFDKYDPALERIVEQVQIADDLYCDNAESFLLNSRGRYGAISALIIDRDAWNSEDVSGGVGTQVMHMWGLCKVLLKGDSFLIKEPLIKVRDGSQKAVSHGDGDSLLTIALASGMLYHAMKDMGYSTKLVDWYLRDDRPYVYDAIPRAKFWGIKDRGSVARKLVHVHNSPVLWFKYMPIIYCPDAIFRKLYTFKKSVSSRTRGIERALKQLIRKTS